MTTQTGGLPDLFPPGLVGLSAAQLAYALSRMKSKADAGGAHLSDYLGLAFWDKTYTPEPQCSAILYVSSSCGDLASNAAARCSEGGMPTTSPLCPCFLMVVQGIECLTIGSCDLRVLWCTLSDGKCIVVAMTSGRAPSSAT